MPGAVQLREALDLALHERKQHIGNRVWGVARHFYEMTAVDGQKKQICVSGVARAILPLPVLRRQIRKTAVTFDLEEIFCSSLDMLWL